MEKKKEALGYAVQEVDGESLQLAKEPNMLSSLTGKVAGLVVYNKTDLLENPEFQIRGATPLIVVDGVPQNSDFWDLNPDNIKSISVLKGTTASALYGSRGRNGAIMITTLKKTGTSPKGVEVTINSSNLFQVGFTAIPETQHQYGNGENGQYEFVDGKGGGIFDGDMVWGPKLDVKDPSTPSGYVERIQYNSPIDPVTGERIPLPWISRGKNNMENFLETGIVSSNTLRIATSNDKGELEFSFSHMHQKGQVDNTQLDISTFSLSGGYDLSPRTRIDAVYTYNYQYTDNYPKRGYGPQNYIYNTIIWMGEDVDINDLRNYWQEGKEGIQQYNFNYVWYNNPWFNGSIQADCIYFKNIRI